ncbi:AMP-binding protein [Sabulilitoribacter arenilitoris]|uniref:AMP-binding protein n=1 Tax=Wocania arenilitoris TaxID=2044858 RepID=A0AAE3JL30_9FLAO|nr:AMP-binding protein [Wocania arenilitoris]MCF7567819.1 AMP-binding protein [Wocania arenilitoris]
MMRFNSPLEAFLHWESETPNRIFIKQPVNGKLITFTFKEAKDEVCKIASKLKSYNLPKRSHVAILSKNCAHWLLSDLAIMMADCVSIPIYPTLNKSSINQILEHSESKAIIIGKLDDFKSQKSGIPDIHKISVGLFGESEGDLWEDIVKTEKSLKILPEINPDQLHTIIYTSGTTGLPKGVMHSVGNIMESIRVIKSIIKMSPKPRLFSYLPLAHVAERVGIGTHGIVIGAEFSFPESLETFASDLEKCQPHLFLAVPRIWVKFQEKILENLPQKKLNILLKTPIINRLIKHKLKQKLGLKDASFIVSGAAPLSASLIHWFKKIDVEIFQVYGMTEDCIISHATRPKVNKIGSVGKALETVQIKFSPEGEILIKNNCLMKGYYKAPEITASVFDEAGYFKTGDKGEYDHDGYLTITGRAKDEFKTDKGKYISPSHIEMLLTKNTDIEQICVVGTGIPQPIALITLSELGRAKSKDVLSNKLVATVNAVNLSLEKHEKVEKVVVMKEDWTVDNNLVTPSLKVKRSSIEKIHQPFYKEWFAMDDKVIFE